MGTMIRQPDEITWTKRDQNYDSKNLVSKLQKIFWNDIFPYLFHEMYYILPCEQLCCQKPC